MEVEIKTCDQMSRIRQKAGEGEGCGAKVVACRYGIPELDLAHNQGKLLPRHLSHWHIL